jgi:hypothetical protein
LSFLSLFDIFSYADIALAVMLFLSPSHLPEIITHTHCFILFYKGLAGVNPLRINLIPMFLAPVLSPILIFVDVVSASLVLISDPVILAGQKEIIAGLVMLKGVFTAMFTLGRLSN